mmetsp:Transcript_24897/g.46032  ORF Transcript_24897/g.46032 Transcript_24897/m.46032 type:complete len:207 (-) Transcript_24897:589-1209(-)
MTGCCFTLRGFFSSNLWNFSSPLCSVLQASFYLFLLPPHPRPPPFFNRAFLSFFTTALVKAFFFENPTRRTFCTSPFRLILRTYLLSFFPSLFSSFLLALLTSSFKKQYLDRKLRRPLSSDYRGTLGPAPSLRIPFFQSKSLMTCGICGGPNFRTPPVNKSQLVSPVTYSAIPDRCRNSGQNERRCSPRSHNTRAYSIWVPCASCW